MAASATSASDWASPPADPHVTETIVGSPFDYARNCLLYVPRHLPMPSDDPGYAYDAANEMIALLEASQGGAFLLFTSYRALNAAYDHLTQSDLPYPILRQGEMPNARLVQTFKAEKNAILLGTQSFWEGVDVPGADLRLVIIDRIPFAVPDSPLNKARVDGITAAGRRLVQRLRLATGAAEVKAGLRALDPHEPGPGRRSDPGHPPGPQDLRRAVPAFPAPRPARLRHCPGGGVLSRAGLASACVEVSV